MRKRASPPNGKNNGFLERNRRSKGYLLRKRARRGAVSLVRGLLLIGLCFMIIQPMIIRFGASLMAEGDLYDTTVVVLPKRATLENYAHVFSLTQMPYSMLNTFWVSLAVSLFQVASCTLVGYGFARFKFKGRGLLFALVVTTIIIPPQTISTALYVRFSFFDIFGIFTALSGKPLNLRGSIAPYLMMSATCMGLKNGLYIFMLRQYFTGVSKSLEEAAYVDGCGVLHTFARVMLPDALPIIVSCFLFSFVWQWTDIFYTRNFLSGLNLYAANLVAMPNRMRLYFSPGSDVEAFIPLAREQQLVSIGVLVCCVPLIVLYIFAQRSFVESIALSGSKE